MVTAHCALHNITTNQPRVTVSDDMIVNGGGGGVQVILVAMLTVMAVLDWWNPARGAVVDERE